MTDRPGIGDAVEIAAVDDGAPGFPTIWIPATVQFVDDAQLVAVFSDGERKAVPRRSSQWRQARR